METTGWTLREIGNLTDYQAMVFAGAKCPEDGRLKLTPEQAAIWRKRKKRGV